MLLCRFFAASVMCLSVLPALADDAPLTTERDRMSYSVGIAFGRSLIQQGANEVNVDQVVKGMTDSFARRPLMLSEEEYRTIYHAFQSQMIAKLGHARSVAAFENKTAADKFFEENATKPGVVTTASRLQYKIITTGTGPKPTDDDMITANYRGRLVDGSEFDSTYKRNQPASFLLRGSIAGWREALKMMPVGSKWELYIPAELAYAKQGAGAAIGPNAMLIFEIELLSVKKKS